MNSKRTRADIIKLIMTSMPWKEVRADLLTAEESAIFKHRKDALERYLAGETLDKIKDATGVGGNFLRKIIARCLTTAPDGMPFGYRALIRNLPTKNYVRKKTECHSFGPKNSGMAGVLGQVFQRYPGLQAKLNEFILKIDSKSKKKVNRMKLDRFCGRPKDVHREFIHLLESHDHPKTEWPFNTNYLGIRTITTYVKELREINIEKIVRISGDDAAIAHLYVGTGEASLVRIVGFNDCWMIDSHTLDYICAIEIVNEQGIPSFKSVTRLHVLLLFEALSRAAIWYRVVYGGDVTSNDISALVREGLAKVLPKPQEVIPNLAPDPGAGFMTEMYPELAQSCPSWISVDNAWANLGNAVCLILRKETGSAFDYGPPKRFERRARIESGFDRFTEELSKRLRSTVGAGPGKGGADDAVEAAVEYRISSDVLEHLTYVAFANFNISTNEGLGNTTPKAAIEGLLAQRDSHFLPRVLPADKLAVIGNALVRLSVTVRGDPEKGIRPFVNFERVRYRFHNSDQVVHLIGHKIFIEVNESDIRGFNAFQLNGEPLGWMTAEGFWGEEPHTRKTRKAINSKRHKRVQEFVNGGNYIRIYNDYLISIANAKGGGRRENRKAAAEVDRLRHDVARATGEPVQSSVRTHTNPRKADAQPAPTPASGWVMPPDDVDIHALLKKIR